MSKYSSQLPCKAKSLDIGQIQAQIFYSTTWLGWMYVLCEFESRLVLAKIVRLGEFCLSRSLSRLQVFIIGLQY